VTCLGLLHDAYAEVVYQWIQYQLEALLSPCLILEMDDLYVSMGMCCLLIDGDDLHFEYT
jgi:hypothetical protein